MSEIAQELRDYPATGKLRDLLDRAAEEIETQENYANLARKDAQREFIARTAPRARIFG